MDWLRKNPLFAAVLALGFTAVVAQGWFIYATWQRTKRAEIALRQRQEERDWLARQSPALSPANSDAITADVAAAEKKLTELRRTLAGRPRWLPAAPKRTTDAYFALASFAEKTRALAVRQQVELRPDERFGFASYANVGPEPELLGAVHRQRVIVEHVVESLLEARPRALLGVQREHPLTEAQRAALRQPATPGAAAPAAEPRAGGEAKDFFEPDPQLRLRLPGLAETEAFRVEFTGQTQTLRAFLNELAAFKLPLVVRSVEVEALPSDPAPAERKIGAPVPLVAQNFSKFAVVLEFVELPPLPATP